MEYKIIPGFNNYGINKNGEVINLVSNNKIKSFNGGRGYISYILYSNGKRKHKYRHVLLMETYKPTSEENMTVDHLNGIPGDDRLENLEWVTMKENIRRYHILKRLVRRPVVIKNFKTNEEKEFNSHIEAAKYLSVNRYEMLRRLHSKHGMMFSDFTMCKYLGDTRDFPIVKDINKYRDSCENSKKCLAYNHFTKEMKEFNNLSECAKLLNVKISSLTSKMKYYSNKIFQSGWEVKLLDDPRDWSSPTDEELNRIRSGAITNKKIVAEKNGEKLFFDKAADCARHFGLTPGGFHWCLKHNNTKPNKSNGYTFNYI